MPTPTTPSPAGNEGENDIETRAIRPDEREACLDLWKTVWPGEHSDAYFRRYFYGDVEWLPYYTQVAVTGGRVVSAAHICKRVVACGEYRLTMGGIANVATLPEFRGRGLNRACLQRAIAVMEADAMDFSLLFTGIPAYYARLGFAGLPRPRWTGRIRADFAPRATAFRVRPARGEDIPALRAIYDTYNRQRPLAVQRSEAYWRDWLGFTPAHLPDPILVATEADGTVRGYARSGQFRSAAPYSPEDAGEAVVEYGALAETVAESEALANALLNGIAARAVAAGARRLQCDFATDPLLAQALDGILETRQETASESGMVRLLHRVNLLRSFAMLWNDRWIAQGRPSGSLTFATPYGPVRLDARGPFLRVEEVEEAVETEGEVNAEDADRDGETFSQSRLFELLFGLIPPERATENTTLHPLLAALFPPQAAVFWGADGF